jgi:hypothetical protein
LREDPLNALRPLGVRPRGRSLGHALLGARPVGRWADRGRRVGRTPPIDLRRNANSGAGVTADKQTPRPGDPRAGVFARAPVLLGGPHPNHRPLKERQRRCRRYGRTSRHSGHRGRRRAGGAWVSVPAWTTRSTRVNASRRAAGRWSRSRHLAGRRDTQTGERPRPRGGPTARGRSRLRHERPRGRPSPGPFGFRACPGT